MEVVLRAIPLVPVGVLSSPEVVASVVSSVVSSSWCPVPVDIHRDRGIVHPARGVGRVVLRCVLSLGLSAIPLGVLLLRGKGSKVSIPSKYISEQNF